MSDYGSRVAAIHDAIAAHAAALAADDPELTGTFNFRIQFHQTDGDVEELIYPAEDPPLDAQAEYDNSAELRSLIRGAAGSPTVRRRRPYAVVDDLESLHGPTDSVVELPLRIDWSPKRHYDLADDGDRRSLYERTLNEALRVEDLQTFLNGDLLVELWPRLWLPQQVRALWEGRFAELASRR